MYKTQFLSYMALKRPAVGTKNHPAQAGQDVPCRPAGKKPQGSRKKGAPRGALLV
jgi:hypothetical protein